MKKLMVAVVGLVAVAGSPARAAGIAVDLQSARGVGMAGSMVGLVDDASGMYFNLLNPVGPLNMIDLHPTLDLYVGEKLTLSLD